MNAGTNTLPLYRNLNPKLHRKLDQPNVKLDLNLARKLNQNLTANLNLTPDHHPSPNLQRWHGRVRALAQVHLDAGVRVVVEVAVEGRGVVAATQTLGWLRVTGKG